MSSSALAASIRQLRRTLAGQQPNQDTDEQLLHAFVIQHDDSAFAALMRRHGPMVLRLCRRVLGHEQDAEDAFQATFLVLARNATALRNKSSLASWLHGTAYRTAMKAKQTAVRRRKYEGQAPSRPSTDPADELSWREVRTLLDEEINRLPEKYRSVFVLCSLEGMCRAEAGQRLGLKERTVLSRLAEARKRLGQRLARRGVELTAVLAATTLATQPVSALSPLLIATTIKAALATAAGEGLAGVVSVSVAELVQGMTTAMAVSRVKIAAFILLAVTLLGGAGAWAYRDLAANVFTSAKPPASKADEKPRVASPKREPAKTMEIHGRVFGPDGKPRAGAKLRLLGEDKKITELGVTAADGSFSISVPKEAKRRDVFAIAQTGDTGFGVLSTDSSKAEKPVEVHLVKDQPIRGRVVNTEGKPVAGVRVAAKKVNIYPNDSLERFLGYWKNRRLNQNPLGGWGPEDAAEVLFATTTDAEGRFILRGVGVERFVPLRIQGAGLADTELWVVTRPNFDPKPINKMVRDNTLMKEALAESGEARQLHGPDVTVVAEPEKIIRGSVKDADSGKGRPNILVQLVRILGPHLETRTDAEGHYEFHGARKAKSYLLEVESDSAAAYMASHVQVHDTPGYQPVTAEIPVKKGVIITGQMIDQSTGKPIDGRVEVAALVGNPFVKKFPAFDSEVRRTSSVENTDADGVFRVVAIPGPVLLMGGPSMTFADLKYKSSVPDPNYRRYFRMESGSLSYYGLGGGFSPIMGGYFKVLEIKPDAKVVEQNIVLERLPALTIQIQDAEGKPLTNVYVTGQTAEGGWSPCYDKSSCSAYGIQPGKPRVMIFYHQVRKLAASITLKGDEKQPVVVKLGAAGAIKGRLLDADGKPLAGIRIDPHYDHRDADTMHRCIHSDKQSVTDAEGYFADDDVIPGFEFGLSFRRGKLRFQRESKPADGAIQVKPGECRDLGAIRVKPSP